MMKKGYFGGNYYSPFEKYYINYSYDRTYYGIKTVTWWSYQWGYARKINSGLVAVPVKNFIVNIGLGAGATNTRGEDRWNFFKFETMEFPLKHPDFVMHDRKTDDEIFKRHFTTPWSRVKSRMKDVLPSFITQKLTKKTHGISR